MNASTDLATRLVEAVNQEVELLLKSAAMQEWTTSSSRRFLAGDLVIFNDSFLYREKATKSNKNGKCLCVRVDQDGQPNLPAMVVNIRAISQFKLLPAKQVEDQQIIELKTAVEHEISKLGVIVRSLVARIRDDEPAEITLDGKCGIEVLQYDPGSQRVAQLTGKTLCVSRFDDIDAVWATAEEALMAAGITGAGAFADKFEAALGELREIAGRPVDIDDVDPVAPSILSEVIEGFEKQMKSYEDALLRHAADPNDTEALNELLRIAYNFADGATLVLSLVVGLSDLKPLLFWMTIASQANLADRFGSLPFAMVGKAKPSLSEYRTLIAGARNRSFHDIFAFERSFRIPLTSAAFEAPELHLFRGYAKRTRPALDFQDRELVELLSNFTRASEREVPAGFWEKNLDVMQGVTEVIKSLRRALLATSGAQ